MFDQGLGLLWFCSSENPLGIIEWWWFITEQHNAQFVEPSLDCLIFVDKEMWISWHLECKEDFVFQNGVWYYCWEAWKCGKWFTCQDWKFTTILDWYFPLPISQKNFVFMTICNAPIDIKVGTMTNVGWLKHCIFRNELLFKIKALLKSVLPFLRKLVLPFLLKMRSWEWECSGTSARTPWCWMEFQIWLSFIEVFRTKKDIFLFGFLQQTIWATRFRIVW